MTTIKFGSVCSGIEAASVAWHPLGWKAAWFSEIEPFPSAVLAHHYPDVPNLGDMTALPDRIASGKIEAPDVFCGGTPCQAFSVAGLRNSLKDARGNLSLVFCEIANEIDAARFWRGSPPAIIFWENVPGVLSTKDNAFGCFLAGLAGENETLIPEPRPIAGESSRWWAWDAKAAEHSPSWPKSGCVFGPARAVAWRTLDAQYFGVAQRRRRVFVVASARNGFDPAAVLFEFDSLRRDTAPSREAREVAPTAPARSLGGCGCDEHIAPTLSAADSGSNRAPVVMTNAIAFPERMSGTQCAATENLAPSMGALNPTAVAYSTKLHNTTSLDANSPPPAVVFDLAQITNNNGGHCTTTVTAMQVRRLTPTECERLQGFPDGYTNIPWRKKPASECPDGPRYKALGNSWAVPVVAWIGQRIQGQFFGVAA